MAIKQDELDPLPDSFLELSDTPDGYADQAGKVAVVKPSEDGLEFQDTAGGADVKSGIVVGVIDGAQGMVFFASAFAGTPNVVLTLRGLQTAFDIPFVLGITVGGFWWKLHKGHPGANHLWDLHWIATDAGNPYP